MMQTNLTMILKILFLNNWQNDKLVRPVDMYGGKYQAPLRSVSLNKDAAMPNIIFGQRTDMQAAVIKPLNWVTVDDIKYPIFPPYVKVKDSLGFEPANWHVYRLIGYIDKPERTWQGKLTGRTLYTPIYGLVSKKGYSYKGHTIIEYGLSTQFEFNKENEWDYFEALNNLDALSDMTDEVERTYFEQDKAYMHHIGELPSYSGMNYAIAEQDRIFEYEQDEVDDSVEGVVLEEAEEPLDNTNGTQSKNQYEWDRYSNNGYEVSTAGDTRFSAKVAKFKPGTVIDGVDVGGETIEDVYQKVIKKSDKGMPPSKDSKLYNPNLTTKEQREDFSYNNGYLPLWQEWARQNPDLIAELAEKAAGKTLTDKFANTNVSQARALSDILIQQQVQDVNNISEKTEAFGVELANGSKDFWSKVNDWVKSNPNGIVAYRKYGDKPETFSGSSVNKGWIGNPFSVTTRGSDTVQQFYDWLVTGNNFGEQRATEQFRQAIIQKILNTPENSKVFYYTELNRPSHATVIGYLIRNKQLLNQNISLTKITDNNQQHTKNEKVLTKQDTKKLNFDEVASKVFDLVNKLGIQTVLVDQSQLIQSATIAQFDSDNNRIKLRKDYEDYVKEAGISLNNLLLHEYIHVITSYAIDNADKMSADVQAAVKTIKATYKTLLEKEKDNYVDFMGSILPDSNDYYGLKSEYEMIAELANPNFRKILSKHNLLDKLISNIKDLIFRLFDKFGISHNPTLEDSLVASLDTLIDNFDSMIYNDWNKTRTAQRWFRDNIQRVSINKYIGNKVMDQVNTQLENEPYEEVAELIINIPTDIARDIYNQLGRQNAKNKPFILSFDGGSIMFARLTGLKPSDKKMQGKYTELDTYDMTIETHPEIIPIEEYEKAGNQYRPLADVGSTQALTSIDLVSLYDQGNRRVSEVLDQLSDLTQEERQTYLNEFAQYMRDNDVNTQDKLEEALRKFICNL